MTWNIITSRQLFPAIFRSFYYQLLPGLIMTGTEVTQVHSCILYRTHILCQAHTQIWQAEDTYLINCWHCHLSLSSLNRHDLLSDQPPRELNFIIFSFATVCAFVCVCTTAEGRSEGSFKALIYDQHYEEMHQMGNTVYNYDNYNWRVLLHRTFSRSWTYSFYRVILRSVLLLKDIAHLCCFEGIENVVNSPTG